MRIIAYFLPQFYSIPENDKHWGNNFTDWVNAKNAKQYFSNHRVPMIPTKFGYYDLSDKHTIKHLSDYSIEKGIDGFAYWHYWFGDKKQALEKVPEEHLRNMDIKQNFFFAWANTNWTKSWVGDDNSIIFEQKYSKQSSIDHFNYLKPFFDDSRYMRKNGKPVIQVINSDIREAQDHIIQLEKLAIEKYGHGIHWIFPEIRDNKRITNYKLSYSLVGFPPGEYAKSNFFFKVKRFLQKYQIYNKPIIISEESYLKHFRHIEQKLTKNNYIPCLLSGWDNTPRYKKRGFIINASISSILSKQFKILFSIINKKNIDIDFVFIKAWNEWAEGNVLEPHKTIDMDDVPTDAIEDFRKLQTKTLID